MVVLAMAVPLVIGVILFGAVLVLCVAFTLRVAVPDMIKDRKRRKGTYHPPTPAALKGVMLPRWGAYKRGSAAREKALWDEDFRRALTK